MNAQQSITKHKTIRREGRQQEAQRVWCKRPVPKKNKIFENRKKSKIRVFFVRVCARESRKIGYISRCECCKIPNDAV